MRLYESAIASRFVFSRKIRSPATFEFCNTIPRKRPIAALPRDDALGQLRPRGSAAKSDHFGWQRRHAVAKNSTVPAGSAQAEFRSGSTTFIKYSSIKSELKTEVSASMNSQSHYCAICIGPRLRARHPRLSRCVADQWRTAIASSAVAKALDDPRMLRPLKVRQTFRFFGGRSEAKVTLCSQP